MTEPALLRNKLSRLIVNLRRILLPACAAALLVTCPSASQGKDTDPRWPAARAEKWYFDKGGWLVGCNFIPSTAINELEMWQADTFDPKTIDRELGWAQDLGFNSIRVFLHNIPWEQDATGFYSRIDQFLDIARKHHIGVMFVLFDSCWDPDPKAGKQHDPVPHVHNSGWVQCPGRDYMAHPEKLDQLKPYVQGIIGHYRADSRVDFWDLYNEPDNINKKKDPEGKLEATLQLLRKTFAWAREMNPTQPVSSGVWKGDWSDPSKLSPMEKLQIENSDIITFHNYASLKDLMKCVESLRKDVRPILCTEYMARPAGSTFEPNLGYLKVQGVGAYNWGFVSGKTQTIYPWDSWTKTYTEEPKVWFHDIFRADGTPFDQKEVDYIKYETGRSKE